VAGTGTRGVIRRLDHVIVAVGDRQEWIPRIRRVLALEPGRMLEGSGAGFTSFSNAEFAIGDGFLGVVEPADEGAQLHRFLARFGEGFYAMSIDVGDVAAAVARWEAAGVPSRGAPGGLTWLGPVGTHGVVYQVIDGMLLGPGANPRYLGVVSMTIAVADVDQATADYQALFGLGDAQAVRDPRLGYRGAVLTIDGSELGDTIVLAQAADPDGELARYAGERGEGIFSFAIAVDDLTGELARLAALGVAVVRGDGPLGARALVDPASLGGVRVELVERR
jgi:catechol 2,3-dioxygenase-like lactoylglutathione lyase family enzyme